jgi:tRNA(Ile)-lysidine synthase TilS/MesJ
LKESDESDKSHSVSTHTWTPQSKFRYLHLQVFDKNAEKQRKRTIRMLATGHHIHRDTSTNLLEVLKKVYEHRSD